MTNQGKRGGEGSDRGGDKSNKRRKFFAATKSAALPLRSKGFLLTCVGGKEYQAAQDALRILKEAYEALHPNAVDAGKPEADAQDLAAALAEEVADLKDKSNQLFSYHKTGVPGLVYIALREDAAGPGPVELAAHVVNGVREARQCRSRVILRFLPVENVCHSSIEAVGKMAKELLPLHFPAGPDVTPLPYAVQYEHRAGGLDRGKLIDTVVESIDKVHKVNLNTPKKTIVVQVIKMACAMSVVEGYKENLKFNLRELGLSDEEREAEKPSATKPDTPKTPADTAETAPAREDPAPTATPSEIEPDTANPPEDIPESAPAGATVQSVEA